VNYVLFAIVVLLVVDRIYLNYRDKEQDRVNSCAKEIFKLLHESSVLHARRIDELGEIMGLMADVLKRSNLQ